MCTQLLERLAAFYEQLDTRIATYQPVCRNRGACCKFDTYGHRLFVTGLEMTWFRHHHADAIALLASEPDARGNVAPAEDRRVADRDRTRPLPVLGSAVAKSCPFQQQGMCTTRIGRPVGCRVFFCESEKDGWQSELSEWALGQLRQIHEEFEVPYTYTEWLTALATPKLLNP